MDYVNNLGSLTLIHTYADVPHLLGNLDLHIPTVPLLPRPLVVLGRDAIVVHGLKALIQGGDGSGRYR